MSGGIFFNCQQNILLALRRMHLNDFKHIYLGAELLVRGGNPYDVEQIFLAARLHQIRTLNPYVYPPFTGQVLAFLTMFPLRQAAVFWFVLNHIFFWSSIVILFVALRLPLSLSYMTLAAVLGGGLFPFYRTLTAGQLNCALLLLISLLWWAYSRHREFWTGFLTAFASLFKLSPGIFILYFLWLRQWRLLGFSLLWLVILSGVSFLITPPAVQFDFIPVLQDMSYGRSTWADLGMDFYRDPYNQSFNSLFHHLLTSNPYTEPWLYLSPAIANLLTYFISFLLLVLVLWLTKSLKEQPTASPPEDLKFSLFLFLSLLLPSLLWDHYLTLLVFPIFVLARRLHREQPIPIFLFIAGVVIISMPFNFSAPAFQRGIGVLAMSTKLWGTLLLFLLNIYFILKYRQPESLK